MAGETTSHKLIRVAGYVAGDTERLDNYGRSPSGRSHRPHGPICIHVDTC